MKRCEIRPIWRKVPDFKKAGNSVLMVLFGVCGILYALFHLIVFALAMCGIIIPLSGQPMNPSLEWMIYICYALLVQYALGMVHWIVCTNSKGLFWLHIWINDRVGNILKIKE